MSEADQELAKDLGPLAALTIGVGTMIGAGIFVLPGTAIENAGWFAVLSFGLGGAIALFTALSASELGTAMPKAGGAYYYVNQALGPLFGSIAGWSNWLGLAFASAFYMVGFGEYIRAIFGVALSVSVGPVAVTSVKAFALVGAVAFVGVNYVGAKETGRLQNAIVILLVSILAVFTVAGAVRAEPANLPPGKGLTPLLTTTGIIFVSYLGFVQITSVAEEIKDPGRNLPRAVIGSVVLVTAIYMLVLITMAAAVDQGFIAEQQLAGRIAIVEVGRLLLGPAGAMALLLGGLLATASSANASILASSRINFAMGRDRLVTPDLNVVHPSFGTPYRSIAITGGLILLFIVAGSVELLATLGSVLHLIIYGLLNVALIVMRETEVVEYAPTYHVPLYPLTPIAGTVLSFALIAFIAPVVIGLGAVLVLGAVGWYFGYARSRTPVHGALSNYILERRDRMPEPIVSAASGVQPDGGEFRVLVPVANPKHETDLITLACAIANQRDGVVEAIHIITVPDQTSLEYASRHFVDERETSQELLAAAERDAGYYGVPFKKSTIFSHRSIDEIFDAAREHDADMVVMGWGVHTAGRAEGTFEELTHTLPCDFLVFKDRGFDPEEILLPTAGGPSSELSAEIARVLMEEFGSEVTVLHVADDIEAGRAFLEEWSVAHELTNAKQLVESGDVDAEIEAAAREATMVILGATEQGLISRLLSGSVVVDVVEEVECSVLITESAHERSLRQRLFGR